MQHSTAQIPVVDDGVNKASKACQENGIIGTVLI